MRKFAICLILVMAAASAAEACGLRATRAERQRIRGVSWGGPAAPPGAGCAGVQVTTAGAGCAGVHATALGCAGSTTTTTTTTTTTRTTRSSATQLVVPMTPPVVVIPK